MKSNVSLPQMLESMVNYRILPTIPLITFAGYHEMVFLPLFNTNIKRVEKELKSMGGKNDEEDASSSFENNRFSVAQINLRENGKRKEGRAKVAESEREKKSKK